MNRKKILRLLSVGRLYSLPAVVTAKVWVLPVDVKRQDIPAVGSRGGSDSLAFCAAAVLTQCRAVRCYGEQWITSRPGVWGTNQPVGVS